MRLGAEYVSLTIHAEYGVWDGTDSVLLGECNGTDMGSLGVDINGVFLGLWIQARPADQLASGTWMLERQTAYEWTSALSMSTQWSSCVFGSQVRPYISRQLELLSPHRAIAQAETNEPSPRRV